MQAAPDDAALRADYIDCLQNLSAGHTGLSFALFPDYRAPVYFRCGSTDLENLLSVLIDQSYNFDFSVAPRRILDLGAYAGYAAIYFAMRFPEAEIFCVEPIAENCRILLLNTLPYRQITCRQAAGWRHAATLSSRSRHGGDAGTQLIAEPAHPTDQIVAFGINQLLRDRHWAAADLIKCDVVGAEAQIFADPTADWLNTLDALVIETYDDLMPGAGNYVAACFDPRRFHHAQYGRKHLYERTPPLTADIISRPTPLWVINPDAGLTPIMVQDVAPVPWGFFVFTGACCQLHPNPPGDHPPARAHVALDLSGHTRLSGEIWHAGEQSAPIDFTVEILTDAGAQLARQSYCLVEGEMRDITLEFAALYGRHWIVMQTTMAPAQPVNANAWARWLNLRLF